MNNSYAQNDEESNDNSSSKDKRSIVVDSADSPNYNQTHGGIQGFLREKN